MGLRDEVDALYLAMIESGNVRTLEYPAAAGGFNLVSDGAAVADAYRAATAVIVAAGVIADPCWLVCIQLGVPVVEAFDADIQILEVAVVIAIVSHGVNAWPVVGWNYPTLTLPYPIKLTGSLALNFNIRKTTGASAAGFNNSHLVCVTGLAT